MIEITHQKVYFSGGPLHGEELVLLKTTEIYEVYSTNQQNTVERRLGFYRGDIPKSETIVAEKTILRRYLDLLGGKNTNMKGNKIAYTT